MNDYGEWIDARGATLEGLAEQGRLWVTDELPKAKTKHITQWRAEAEPRNTMMHLIAKWRRGIPLPHTLQARQHAFATAVAVAGPLALIVEDAHCLRASMLPLFHQLTELPGAPMVVLVGDPARIRVNASSYPDFYQRAGYVVHVTRLFTR